MPHLLSRPYWVRTWNAVRQPVIASLVLLHFGAGLFCFLKPPCALLQVPAVSWLVENYRSLDLAQTWRMFAPPSQTRDEVQMAMELPGGWTPLLPLDHFLAEQSEERTWLPGGYLRLANHFRHPNFQKQRLRDEVFFWQYFQAMSAFYCRGDGKLPEIRTVRFYSVTHGVEPFFEKDGDGHPLPRASDFDKVEAVYERKCS